MATKLEDLAQSKFILLVLLWCDLIDTMIKEIIEVSQDTSRGAARAALAMFIINILFMIAVCIATTILVRIFCKYTVREKCILLSLMVIQIIAALLYFYGDNVEHLLLRHGTHFIKCDETTCGEKLGTLLDKIKISAAVALAISLFLFQKTPSILQSCAGDDAFDDEDKGSLSAIFKNNSLHMVPTFIKIDILYTGISLLASFSNSDENKPSTIQIVLTSFVYALGVISIWIFGFIAVYRESKKCRKIFMSIFVFIGALILATYLMADNLFPLSNVFKCSDVDNVEECEMKRKSGLKLGFTLMVMIYYGAYHIYEITLYCLEKKLHFIL